MRDISLHILDIVQNSISAQAKLIEVAITESVKENIYQVTINDNGKGIEADKLPYVTDAFHTSRTTRKVGLGLPLFKQNAELTGGSFHIESQVGAGTKVVATFIYNSIDRIPPGDLVGTYLITINSNPEIDFVFSHITDNGNFSLDTREVKAILEGMPITSPEIRKYLKEMIEENLKEIGVKIM
jgi:hypothetical protein